MLLTSLCMFLAAVAALASPGEVVLEAQAARVAAMARASRATLAIFDAKGEGGGSGVVISPDGFALTNFHVVAPCGAAMKCGMNDGRSYDAVVVGVDPVGDLAMIQVLGRDDFPTAPLGDSDLVRAGDWVFAAGNPFLLADDFSPSISYGIVSGVHRYQYPAGTLLEYTDCLQTDAAINPGNSGGPLFDAEARVIGINGRGSFEKRGRVNVGVGYAISVNQAKLFLSHLRSGRIVDHATLGATVSTQDDGRVTVDDIFDGSDAYRRGLRYGDEIVHFAGREIATANQLKNVLGIFPSGWTVPLVYRRDGISAEIRVRLMGVHDPEQLFEMVQQEQRKPTRPPEGELPEEEPEEDPLLPVHALGKPEIPAAVAARYGTRHGYANYWYNQQKQNALWQRLVNSTDLPPGMVDWQLAGDSDGGRFSLETTFDGASFATSRGKFAASFVGELDEQLSPPGSGGLLLALHLWQRMLDKGLERFGEVYYLGQLPAGEDGRLLDCLVGLHGGVEVRFLFDPDDGQLAGFDLFPGEAFDPCEVRFQRGGELGDRRLPTRWTVSYAGQSYATLRIESWEVGE